MSQKFVDPYIDPQSGILRNLVGATTYDELNNAEGELVAIRMSQFIECLPIQPIGSLDDLCFIHHWLFQDIFDWAGKIRTVEIRKRTDGSEFFLPSVNIATGIEWSQGELRRDHFLVGLSPNNFINRIAYHYDNYNFVHPFREGNGRTQRLMWSMICHQAGYDLDWRLASGEENDEARRLAAEEQDYTGLIKMFEKITCPCDSSVPINAGMVVGGKHLSE